MYKKLLSFLLCLALLVPAVPAFTAIDEPAEATPAPAVSQSAVITSVESGDPGSVIPAANRGIVFAYLFTQPVMNPGEPDGTEWRNGYTHINGPYIDFDMTQHGTHRLVLPAWGSIDEDPIPSSGIIHDGNARIQLIRPVTLPAGNLPVVVESISVNGDARIGERAITANGSFWNNVPGTYFGNIALPGPTTISTNHAALAGLPAPMTQRQFSMQAAAGAADRAALQPILAGDVVVITIRVGDGSPDEPDPTDVEYIVNFELPLGIAPWGASPWGRPYVGHNRDAQFNGASYGSASWYWEHPSWGSPRNIVTRPAGERPPGELNANNPDHAPWLAAHNALRDANRLRTRDIADINARADACPDYTLGLTRAKLRDARYLVFEFDAPVAAGNVEFRLGNDLTGYYFAGGNATSAGPAHITLPGNSQKQFVFDLSQVPEAERDRAQSSNGFRIMANFPEGSRLVRAYLSNGPIHIVKVVANNGVKDTTNTTEITIDLGQEVSGLAIGDIDFPNLYGAIPRHTSGAGQAALTHEGNGVYRISGVRARQPGMAEFVVDMVRGTGANRVSQFRAYGQVEMHVGINERPDLAAHLATHNRPFPQAGLETAPYAIEPLKRTGLTQDDMNQDIIDMFKYRIRDFLIDPNPSIANDPDNFRMVLKHGPGFGQLGSGYDGGASAVQVTCSESMGFGMVMLALMAGADEHFIGNEDARKNLMVVGGRQLTLKDYFDGMMRSLDFWPISHTARLNPGKNPRVSDLMNWEIYHTPTLDYFSSSSSATAPLPPPNLQRGGGTATDGDLDMTYALILADRQWGSGNGNPDYIGKAMRMLDDQWWIIVDRNAANPRYFLSLGDWADNTANGHANTRSSDYMLAHFKVFAELDPRWNNVVMATYDILRQVRHPETGLVSDYFRLDNRANGQWRRARFQVERLQENFQTDSMFDENACRTPWRYATNVLLFGETDIPNVPPLFTPIIGGDFSTSRPSDAYMEALAAGNTVNFGDILTRPLNDTMYARTGGDPRNISFGYNVDGTPKREVPGYITGTDWSFDMTGRWGPGQTTADWKVDRGNGEPCFASPFLVPAAIYGPQHWFDRHWDLAKTQTRTINFYGEYMTIFAMITASGNYWNPLAEQQGPDQNAEYTVNFDFPLGIRPLGFSPWGRPYVGHGTTRDAEFTGAAYGNASWYWNNQEWGRPREWGHWAPPDTVQTNTWYECPDWTFGLSRARLDAANYLVLQFEAPVTGDVQFRLGTALGGFYWEGGTRLRGTGGPPQGGPAHGTIQGNSQTQFVFDLSQVPAAELASAQESTGFRVMAKFPELTDGNRLIRAYLSRGFVQQAKLAANGTAGEVTTTEIMIDLGEEVPGLAVSDIDFPHLYGATWAATLTHEGEGLYRLSGLRIRHPGKAEMVIDVVRNEGFGLFSEYRAYGEVVVHVRVAESPNLAAHKAAHNRPFPQAGLPTAPYVVDRLTHSNLTQAQMNQDVIDMFKYRIRDFLIDPNPNTVNDPDNFRMVLKHGPGHGNAGRGYDGGAAGTQVTCSESMGFGMMLLVLMAGADEHFIGNEDARHNLMVVGGRQLTLKDYFDGMMRSLEFWPANNDTSRLTRMNPNKPGVGGQNNDLMRWQIHHNIARGNDYFSGGANDATPISMQRGGGTATDGDLDMSYALILADRQWGSGGGNPDYLNKAMRMIDDQFWLIVDRPEVNPRFFLSLADTVNNLTGGDGSMSAALRHLSTNTTDQRIREGDIPSRPLAPNAAGTGVVRGNEGYHYRTRSSDYMLAHLKVFEQLDTANPWSEVITASYDILRQIASSQNPPQGLMPDYFLLHDRVNNIYRAPRSGFEEAQENVFTDGMFDENACRTPWRYATNVLLWGDTDIPTSPPLWTSIDRVDGKWVVSSPGEAHLNAPTVKFSSLVTRAMNDNMYARTGGDPRNISFGYAMDGTPKREVDNYRTDTGGPNWRSSDWKVDRGNGEPCFTSNFLVPAAIYGPQSWFDAHWDYAKTQTGTINFYGEYMTVFSMITASGNYWNPLVQESHTVTFMVDEEVYAMVEVKDGQKLSDIPDNPKKEGYAFIGWFDGEVKFDFDAPVMANVTLTAKWAEIVYHTVTFDTNGVTEIEPVTVADGETVERPDDPVREGYTFITWLLDGEEFDFETAITEDIILVADWELVPITSLRINAAIIETVARGWRYNFGVIVNEGAITDGIVWTISNPALAHVDERGTVTIFERTGTVVLLATDPVSNISHSIMLRIAS